METIQETNAPSKLASLLEQAHQRGADDGMSMKEMVEWLAQELSK